MTNSSFNLFWSLGLLLTAACVADPKTSATDSGGPELDGGADGGADTGADPGSDVHTTMVFTSTDYMVYSLGTLDLETRGKGGFVVSRWPRDGRRGGTVNIPAFRV